MAELILPDLIALEWEEEGVYARNVDGQLVRYFGAREEDYLKAAKVVIDGAATPMPLARPLTDAQGNIVRDAEGRTIPRYSTIYDAAVELFRVKKGDPTAPLPIPTLCHAEHLRPAGVCRICSVVAEKPGGGGRGKLVPACTQRLEDALQVGEMIVHTMRSPDARAAGRVRANIKVLLELLASDHLPPQPGAGERRSEFAELVERLGPELGLVRDRYAWTKPAGRSRDNSSPLMTVNHEACILCDRCARACNEVKLNYVIGRSGKGYAAKMGFDLDDPMGQSSCVECGECMLSCPTETLVFKQPVETSEWHREQVRLPGRSEISPEEMARHRLLGALPFRFLQWNRYSVVRRELQPGDTLCELGDYGSSAFLIDEGEFEGWTRGPAGESTQAAPSWWRRLLSGGGRPAAAPAGPADFTLTPNDYVVGEMTCLNSYPRNATVRAKTPGRVLEIRRNVLFALQRNPVARKLLNDLYRRRAISTHLRNVAFFNGLAESDRARCEAFLAERVELVLLEPGQIVFRQGEQADCFYLVRVGYVKIARQAGGGERVLTYLGPDSWFGEGGLVVDMPELAQRLPPDLETRRNAAASALDDVELVRIDKAAFQELLRRFPVLQDRVLEQARVRSPATELSGERDSALLDRFLSQGLFNGQKLLVLDLEACTRCDECTRACSDTHEGVTRLIREGYRFDKWLVASACRSCTDPYCLVGCPVDAIHRDGEHKAIRIESHCIGCGLCAKNCPYGNINMHGVTSGGETRHRATTCDLCRKLVGPQQDVSCVFACPHHAAFRLSGQELWRQVESGS